MRLSFGGMSLRRSVVEIMVLSCLASSPNRVRRFLPGTKASRVARFSNMSHSSASLRP